MRKNKQLIRAVLLFTVLCCASVARAQGILDLVMAANNLESVSYDYLMGIRSEGKVVQQLHGKLQSSPEGYCDSNDEQLIVRYETVYFSANTKLKTLGLGFVKPDSADQIKRDRGFARKLRDFLLSHSASYFHVDSSGSNTIRINMHFGRGQVSDMELVVMKGSYRLVSFSMKQQFLVEDALYDYELSAFNLNTDFDFRDVDTKRFFSVQNRRIIPARTWSDYKISYL